MGLVVGRVSNCWADNRVPGAVALALLPVGFRLCTWVEGTCNVPLRARGWREWVAGARPALAAT